MIVPDPRFIVAVGSSLSKNGCELSRDEMIEVCTDLLNDGTSICSIMVYQVIASGGPSVKVELS